MDSIKSKVQVPIKRTVVSKSFKLIDFRAYDHTISESSSNESDSKSSYSTSAFMIQMFGVNEKGETCSISVPDYLPFFYIRVVDEWTETDTGRLRQTFIRELGYQGKYIVNLELCENRKLYGFSADKKFKFVKISFANMSAFNKTKNLWYTEFNGERVRKNYRFEGKVLELYESNIPPLLRCFHIHNISPSGWIKISTNHAILHSESQTDIKYTKSTNCDFEYTSSIAHVQPLPQKETAVPYKICSFDIEASSSHGDFPVPIKTYKRLVSNMVDIFQKHCVVDDSNRNRVLVHRIVMTAFGYDRFDDVDKVFPKTPISREDLVIAIQKLLNETIANAKKRNAESNSKLVRIDSIFDKMKTEVLDIQEHHDVSNDDDDEHDDSNNTFIFSDKNKNKSKKIKMTSKTTILDILQNDEYDRDDKIQTVNDVFSSLVEIFVFPGLEGDKVTFIGSTFLNYGSSKPYLNHCLVLGTCDPVEDAEIVSVDTERDLLVQWMELVQYENPDIIIGYNIFGFDYEFMFRRSQENNCDREFLKLSRIKDEVCGQPEGGYKNPTSDLIIENTKVVLASGEYDLRYVKMPGRIQIDMYTYFRRDFNLSSYKLDDVSGQFISDDISTIKHENHTEFGEVTELYSKNLTGLNVNDYIHIEVIGFTTDYFADGKKFKVLDIIKNKEITDSKGQLVKYNVLVIAGHHTINMSKSVKWGMAKDDVSPQDIFRLANGSASDRAIVAKYCIQDCNLVHHLLSKIDVITGYVEMSRICSVPISFLVFRGQGIKLTSYVAKKCRDKNTLMPDLEKSGSDDGYEGAIVLPPKCSIYMDNPVAVVDYASLYPSSMISQNYSHDSKVWMKEYDLNDKLIKQTGEIDKTGTFIYDNLQGYEYIDTEFDTFKYVRKTPTSKAEKVKSGKTVCRWVQLPNNQKSILPSILEELLKARADTRKMIKSEKDPFMQNILDKRQLAYKVTANSLYGQCGARTSTFYEKDVAASTTATGRMMIMYAKQMIEGIYGDRKYETKNHGTVQTSAECIYGDTDSVFFTFHLSDPITNEPIRGKRALEITIEIAQDAAVLCSDFLKSPMELSYEKTMMPFILLSKKRYVGMLYETNPEKGKLKYMGLSLKRRDSCDYLKDTYGEILNILMRGNIGSAIDFLNRALNELVDGKIAMDKLTITRALRSDYKNPGQIAHKVLSDRIGQRDPGNKPKPGDRIKFVFVNHKNPKALLGERIETPEFILESGVKIDYMYYITNQLMKPLQQLFGLALVQIYEYKGHKSALTRYMEEVKKIEKEFAADYEIFMKKKEKFCSAKVKVALFDGILTKVSNERNHLQMITNFYN